MQAKSEKETGSLRKGARSMLELLGILALWILLQWVIFPKLGVPT